MTPSCFGYVYSLYVYLATDACRGIILLTLELSSS